MKLAWLMVTVSLTITQAALSLSCEVPGGWQAAMALTIGVAWVLLVADFLWGRPWPD